MTQRPKITITKLFVRSPSTGHFRYYSPFFDNNKKYNAKFPRPKSPTFDLSGVDNRYPGATSIRTEKQLCRFIYENYGEGIYRVMGHLKGRHGSYTFWRGEINKDGFIFFKKSRPQSNIKSIEKLKKEMDVVESEEERQIIQEDIDMEREIGKIDIETTKYGFVPFLLPSGKRDSMNLWEDEDVNLNKESEINDNWEDSKKTEEEEEFIW